MVNHNQNYAPVFNPRKVTVVSLVFFTLGVAAFVFGIFGNRPGAAWQALLINFLLFSGMAQGGVVFSAVMHLTKARWTGPLSGLSESFAAFFPVSFALFLLLFVGKTHIFPWLGMDLHGKEAWLNIPFLFTRDCLGLFMLYLLGFIYLHHTMKLRLMCNSESVDEPGHGRVRHKLFSRMLEGYDSVENVQRKASITGALYIVAFTLIQSLMGFDLVMSADPHWFSTLFGAYTFVKSFYIALGALIILAACYHLRHRPDSGLKTSHFHDAGKLFFAFCLLWADFLYVQFLVIWYGNLPEEAGYIITRTMTEPWNGLAWSVFAVCFILPFIILLNKTIKTKPVFMIVLCTAVILGIWLEHYLLLGPIFVARAAALPIHWMDAMIFLGFLGMLMIAVSVFLNRFPELLWTTCPAREDAGEER